MTYTSRRKFIGILAGTCLCLPISKVLAKEVHNYKYVVAADPQLWWRKNEDNSVWLEVIRQVNGLQPDFMIVCGDLICLPNDPKLIDWDRADKMADSYMEGVSRLDKNIPIYNVAGNHDVSNFPTKTTLKRYKKRFGRPWYSFVHKKSLFVVIESNVLANPDGYREAYQDQLDWLEKLLVKSIKKDYEHRTVYMHHPLFVKDPEEGHTYHNMPKEIRDRLLNLFVESNVEIVFSGHLHSNMYAKHKGMELITTESACHGAEKGVRVVEVKGAKIYDKFVQL